VEQLLREASRDPKVRAIKMTLYRTSDDSRALGYLIDAARNGKQVAVVMELKARFDEAANIRWANRMGEMGIHVTYGVVGLKTHCKAILIVRQDYYGIKRYTHVGTGNFHAETARLYSDIGLFTCDDQIGEDLTELFNYLTTGFKPNRRYHKLLPSPKIFKRALLEKIEREVKKHRRDGDGLIQFKMNALEDPDITRALYQAAQAGVHVDLLIRDSCRLRPGIPGLSENVRVISVVGRFLEHARLYYFRNGGDEEYLIGSADCMSRNLMSRVEIVVPVESPELREQLRFMLDTQLADLRSAWEMLSDGSYVQCQSDGKPAKGTHQVLATWAERRYKEATRLKRRKPRGISQLMED
jgi:polyphosphate kinase